jgi:hypothetical protein
MEQDEISAVNVTQITPIPATFLNVDSRAVNFS